MPLTHEAAATLDTTYSERIATGRGQRILDRMDDAAVRELFERIGITKTLRAAPTTFAVPSTSKQWVQAEATAKANGTQDKP
jgi:hypothetical protein